MRFQEAFDPFRALGEAWRILLRAPVPMFVGGVALVLLADGGEGLSIESGWSSDVRVDDWEGVAELLLVALFGGFACAVQVALFLAACFVGVTFPRAVLKVARSGSATVSDLLSPAGRFLPMLVTQIACGIVHLLVLGAFGGLALGFAALGAALGASSVGVAIGSLVFLGGIPVWLYFYLGLRLAEPAVALDGLAPFEAMRRSWILVRGNRPWFFLYLAALAIFQLLGVLLCCVGVLATGTLRVIAINESYLRLSRDEGEQREWWLVESDPARPARAALPPPS